MFNIETGTATYSRKENLSDFAVTSMEWQPKNSYSYERINSEIDTTLSTISNKYENSENTVEDGFEKISTKKMAITETPVKPLKSIYFGKDFISSELRMAVGLLDTSRKYVENAIESLRQGRRKDSDEFVMLFKAFLPELFCCRTISESFGAVINSVSRALSNMNGIPLSEEQLVALRDIIQGLLREPAMSFERSVEYVSEFEKADFEVESSGLDDLLELIEMFDKGEIKK